MILHTPLAMIREGVHTCLLVAWSAVIYYDFFVLGFPYGPTAKLANIAQRFRFLTVWNMVSQCLYFYLSFAADLCPFVCTSEVTSSGVKNLKCWVVKARDTMFTAVVSPLGLFIPVTFWILFNVDRELIYPKALDEIIPLWLNHFEHSLIGLFVLVEAMIVRHEYPSVFKGCLQVAAFDILYVTWVFWLRYYTSEWVYPVFTKLSPIGLAVFITGCLIISLLFYGLGRVLNRLRWKTAREKEKGT